MNKTKTLSRAAILCAFSIVIFVLEAQIPPLTPIPGIKPGLSNIITLFALETLGGAWVFALLLVRCILGNLLTGQVLAILYSLSGGICAFGVMRLLKGRFPKNQLFIVSIFGAVTHNAVQLVTAVFVTGTAEILWYFPVLLIAAILAGGFTGLCTQFVLKKLHKEELL